MYEKFKMNVEFTVTEPQALALQVMFEQWTRMGNSGASADVAFRVDGDGPFSPKCKVTFENPVMELNDTIRALAKYKKRDCELSYDFDAILGWFQEGKPILEIY